MIAALAVLADLCTPVPPAPAADPADAAAYIAAGDEARAAGDVRIAALAYRRALASDPKASGASTALAALCASDALVPHTGPTSDDLAAAIRYFELGDPTRARTALDAIVAGDATDAGAHVFLALLALHRHDGAAGRGHLDLARHDPGYADAIAVVSRLASRDGPIAVTLLAQPEHDTNPQLVPDRPPAGATLGPPMADQSLLLAATIAFRPTSWLVARNALVWRKQRRLTELDFLGETAQIAVERDRRSSRISIRYDLDYDLLDGSSYLIANRATGSVRRELGTIALDGEYSIRRRSYLQDASRPFTGWVHRGEAGGVMHLTPRYDVELHAVARRETTSDPTFAFIEIGGAIALRGRPLDRVRTRLDVAAAYASYDAAEPDGTVRDDRHFDAGLDLEVDLANRWVAIGGADLAINGSTVEDFRFTKITARLGVMFAFGVP